MLVSSFLWEDFNSSELQNLSSHGTQVEALASLLDKLMSSRNLLLKCCWLVKRSLLELGINPTEELLNSSRQDQFNIFSKTKTQSDPSSLLLSPTTLASDWTFIFRELEAWQSDTSDLLNTHMLNLQFLDSNRALEDSRLSRAESHNVNRLTYLAAVFIPLSFISSLLSMGADYIPGGGPHFWMYWAISLSLCAALFALIFLAQMRDRLENRVSAQTRVKEAQDLPKSGPPTFSTGNPIQSRLRDFRLGLQGRLDVPPRAYAGPSLYSMSEAPRGPVPSRMTID